jgi:hypothetical protein
MPEFRAAWEELISEGMGAGRISVLSEVTALFLTG